VWERLHQTGEPRGRRAKPSVLCEPVSQLICNSCARAAPAGTEASISKFGSGASRETEGHVQQAPHHRSDSCKSPEARRNSNRFVTTPGGTRTGPARPPPEEDLRFSQKGETPRTPLSDSSRGGHGDRLDVLQHVRRLSRGRSAAKEGDLRQSPRSSSPDAGSQPRPRAALKLSRSILQQERDQKEYQLNGEWIESLRSDADPAQISVGSSATGFRSARKQRWNGDTAHDLYSSGSFPRRRSSHTKNNTWSDAESESEEVHSPARFPAHDNALVDTSAMSVEAKIGHIRDALKNEKRVAGGGSLSHRTLSSFIAELLNTCESLLSAKKEMLQHRSILAREVEKVWSICDERELQNNELLRQNHVLQAVNADLETTNSQLLTRLNTAIDAALKEDPDKAVASRSRSYFSSARSSPGSSQRGSPASGPIFWTTPDGMSMLASDAALEAKYALMESKHDGVSSGVSSEDSPSCGASEPASSRNSSPSKTASSGRRSVLELLTGQADAGSKRSMNHSYNRHTLDNL